MGSNQDSRSLVSHSHHFHQSQKGAIGPRRANDGKSRRRKSYTTTAIPCRYILVSLPNVSSHNLAIGNHGDLNHAPTPFSSPRVISPPLPPVVDGKPVLATRLTRHWRSVFNTPQLSRGCILRRKRRGGARRNRACRITRPDRLGTTWEGPRNLQGCCACCLVSFVRVRLSPSVLCRSATALPMAIMQWESKPGSRVVVWK